MRVRFSLRAACSRVGDHGVNIVITIRLEINVKIQIFVRNVAKKTIVRRIRGCYIISVSNYYIKIKLISHINELCHIIKGNHYNFPITDFKMYL